MTDTEKELLDCLKEYIKQTETAHIQEGIWFNKVYKDAKDLVKKSDSLHSVSESSLEDCEDCEYVMYNDDTAICKKCESCITIHKP